jgi:hypothetical protein
MIFPYVDANYGTLGSRGLLFWAFVFLTSSKHRNPHTGWQEPQSDQKSSLHVAKEINSLWSEKYRDTHRVYSMIAWYSLLSEIVTNSPVNSSCQDPQKLWNTMKHSGRTFISAKILCGGKQYICPSWNWTHTVRPTQGCSSKWLRGCNIISTNQWMANWTRNITHTHKVMISWLSSTKWIS